MNDVKEEKTLDERQRWRLILGSSAAESPALDADSLRMDQALEALYGGGEDGDKKRGGLGASAPKISRWLGDIREFFPHSVVQLIQRDALKRFNLRQLLTEKEMLDSIIPDVHWLATLMSLSQVIPQKNKELVRDIIRRVVDELLQKLSAPMQQAVLGALNRSQSIRNPRPREIDWHRTIRRNLKHYQPEHQSIIPEVRWGFARKRRALRDVVLCIDQSGSMGTSVVYSGIFGAVMASLPALNTKMVAFDTQVADLSEGLQDPVDLLFGLQLGGGTDIQRALAYCQSQIQRPQDTILVLITDLYEGGQPERMLRRMQQLLQAGVQLIVLLALNDEGAPAYDKHMAAQVASLGAPVFACTPDQFPGLMAAALNRQDLQLWVSENIQS